MSIHGVSNMSVLKQVATVVVAIVMVLSIAGASAAFAVNGTILNSDHIAGTFEDEGVYESVAADGRERISGDLDDTFEQRADDIPAGITFDIDGQAAAEAALTEAYVAGEFATNIDQLLAYLKGDTAKLSLQVDLVPVKVSLGEYVANDTITVDTVALANERGINVTTAGVTVDSELLARLNEDRAGYEQTRIQLRSQAVEGADVPVSLDANGSVVVDTATFLRQTAFDAEQDGVTVDTAMLLRMNANQSGYAHARVDIRSQALRQTDIPMTIADDGSVAVNTVNISQEANFTSSQDDVAIDDGMIARLNANQSGYDAVRVEVRSQALTAFPVDVDGNGTVVVETVDIAREIDFESDTADIDVTNDMIERLNDGSDGYAAVRSDIRDQVRDELPPMATSAQVDSALREINTELTASATSQARTDYGDNVTEETLDDIIALQNTVIDGLTDPDLTDYDDYATRRDDNEATLSDSFGRELDDGLREANDAIKTDAAEQARTDYGDSVSNETLGDIVALQNTVIDGLTDPDLTDYDEYATRRDADETALEESLTTELEDRLGDVNEEIKADAAAEVQSEYGDDVSAETLANITALQHTVIDGLTRPNRTYDEYASQRDADEAALAASFDRELDDKLRDAGTEVKADAADRIRNEYGDDVSGDTLDDVIALQNTVVDGLTDPDLTYDAYASQRDDAEAALEASLAAELRDRIDDQVDDRIALGNVTGEGADALSTVRSGVGLVGSLGLVLGLLFLALVGVVYAITRSIHRTVSTTGYSLLVAGIVGVAVGILANAPVLDLVDTALESSEDELSGTGVGEAIRSIIESLFGALTMQSAVLAIVGVVLVAFVLAEKRGHLEALKERARGS
ncbi:putative membrane protein [Halorhabdus sp. SVX81]|nr:putative membrane protein [Halorhabdus sp. SVX81]